MPANQPTKPVESPKPMYVVTSVEDLIKQAEAGNFTLSPEAKAELEKLKSAHETLEAPKRLSDAETEVTAELPKALEAIASKHKVSFAGRKIVVVFKASPKEGEPNPLVSFGPEVETVAAKKRSGGNGKGFKSHGEVVFHPEAGKEIHFASFGAMAKDKGWKMEGRANATVAITNPTTQAEWDKMSSDERKALPTLYRIEAKEVDGKSIQNVYPVSAS
jgi:hypothetical protein